ncbi:uncharacterized protein LOC111864168 isoform X2 [Cryptotermes secundus]|uniref:uncharacterized protein LOC111864168 isoform X2 n=1 Tax=Cryptotermes secundus TaxID=105785 RepID=UPI000CD7C9FE|nr:uncharacterized protein LOC111864168 isoform X2 [Cryptotermes secundus]
MTPFGVLFAIVAMTSVSVRIVGGYIEIVKDWGCDTTEFRLTCRVLEAQIAILDAFFTGNTSSCTSPAVGTANKTPTAKPPFLEEDDNETSVTFNSSTLLRVPREAVSSDKKQITLPVKHRCSGVNHCSFRLTSDYKAAEEWGPGVVFIKYACINHEHITKNCQQDITVVGEGFVETPGYPQFNVERNCAWKLRTQEGQRIQLSFLDISLRDIGSSETKCTDRLTVEEEDRELLSVCGEKEESIVIESDGGGLDVFVSIRSKNIFPKRGVLFQYKDVTNTIWTRNSSLIRLPDTDTNLTTAMAAVIKESDFIYDIILPTLIICLLLIGNGVIIFIIFYLRKRRKLAQQADDEELGAIFQPHDGSVNDKAISV